MNAYNAIAKFNNQSDKMLRRDIHRFKEERKGDKKALRKHFKQTQMDIQKGMHFEPKTVIEAVNEDEREYLSDSDFESQNEQ